ncbi:hypothetical protein [Pedobacter sp. FW305-3-2-15-E-R2A2]|uniref:hypothetical protein n=1 Tax=Pedobacter sp. FW305-3-2-15-E-R2A2 TaxID=3140251 RepID=UPI00313FF20A
MSLSRIFNIFILMLDRFALSSEKLHGLLLEKDVKFLYHANTVATSRTLIQAGSLLSRHEVALKEGFQTKQFTDDKDVIHDVWDSIFVDGTDHHQFCFDSLWIYC